MNTQNMVLKSQYVRRNKGRGFTCIKDFVYKTIEDMKNTQKKIKRHELHLPKTNKMNRRTKSKTNYKIEIIDGKEDDYMDQEFRKWHMGWHRYGKAEET